MNTTNTTDKKKVGHSAAYEKYFEGYTEYRDPETDKIQRVYTEDFYCSSLTPAQLSRRRAGYAALFILSAAAWMTSSLSEYMAVDGITETILAVCIAADALGLLFELIYLVFYCTAPRNMTIYKYKETSINLKKASLFCTISLAATAVAALLHFLFHLHLIPLSFLVIVPAYLCAAAASFGIRFLETRTDYVRVPNHATVPYSDENIVH